MSDEEEITCKCSECKKEVSEEGVKCEMCENWYHTKCQGVSKALFMQRYKRQEVMMRSSLAYTGTARGVMELA